MKVKTRTQYVIVGSDYSAQEPRLMTHLSGDPHLRETFEHDKDPYATLCAPAFHLDYWDCMEHTKDGEPNPDGKKMRSKGKVLMLGISYGMGAKNMAKSMGIPFEECKQVLADFYETFPKIKEFSERNSRDVSEKGYVEDYMGRRRHLPDALKEELEITQTQTVKTNADTLLDVMCEDSYVEVPDKDAIAKWTKVWEDYNKGNSFEAKKKFKKLAEENNISVHDNGAFIAKTRTQCTNARIQGSAATLTKKAMLKIFNDEKMKELGFRLLIPVHDELLGECPMENAEEVSKRLSELMIEATKPEISIKFKCDPYIAKHWYADEVEHEIHNLFTQYVKGNIKKNIQPMSEDEAISKIVEEYSELPIDTIKQMCYGNYDVLREDV